MFKKEKEKNCYFWIEVCTDCILIEKNSYYNELVKKIAFHFTSMLDTFFFLINFRTSVGQEHSREKA